MKIHTTAVLRAATLALALPILGMSAAVQINGTCYGPGSCTNPANLTDAVTASTPVSGTLNTPFSVGADNYTASVVYSTTYTSGSFISVVPTVTFVSGPAPGDTVTLDFLQDIYDNSPGSFDGIYNEDVILNVPTDTTASGQLLVDGQSVGLVGPYGAGFYNVPGSANLSGLNGDYLAFDYQFVFTFAANTPTGTTVSSPNAPEPAQTIPAALSLVGIALVALRRRK
jgi:hypothetical protein